MSHMCGRCGETIETVARQVTQSCPADSNGVHKWSSDENPAAPPLAPTLRFRNATEQKAWMQAYVACLRNALSPAMERHVLRREADAMIEAARDRARPQ